MPLSGAAAVFSVLTGGSSGWRSPVLTSPQAGCVVSVESSDLM